MLRILCAFLATFALTTIAFAQDEATTDVDPRYTWDLTELFASVEDWESARQKVMEDYEKIEARRGTLGDSANALYETLSLVSDTLKEAGRVFVYASLNADEDLRDTRPQERRQLGRKMFGRFNEAT